MPHYARWRGAGGRLFLMIMVSVCSQHLPVVPGLCYRIIFGGASDARRELLDRASSMQTGRSVQEPVV